MVGHRHLFSLHHQNRTGVIADRNTHAYEGLDISKTQRAVEQILRDPVDSCGARTVTRVTCNSQVGPTIKRGDEFSCDATVDGAPRRVAVVFQDDDGTCGPARPTDPQNPRVTSTTGVHLFSSPR